MEVLADLMFLRRKELLTEPVLRPGDDKGAKGGHVPDPTTIHRCFRMFSVRRPPQPVSSRAEASSVGSAQKICEATSDSSRVSQSHQRSPDRLGHGRRRVMCCSLAILSTKLPCCSFG